MDLRIHLFFLWLGGCSTSGPMSSRGGLRPAMRSARIWHPGPMSSRGGLRPTKRSACSGTHSRICDPSRQPSADCHALLRIPHVFARRPSADEAICLFKHPPPDLRSKPPILGRLPRALAERSQRQGTEHDANPRQIATRSCRALAKTWRGGRSRSKTAIMLHARRRRDSLQRPCRSRRMLYLAPYSI